MKKTTESITFICWQCMLEYSVLSAALFFLGEGNWVVITVYFHVSSKLSYCVFRYVLQLIILHTNTCLSDWDARFRPTMFLFGFVYLAEFGVQMLLMSWLFRFLVQLEGRSSRILKSPVDVAVLKTCCDICKMFSTLFNTGSTTTCGIWVMTNPSYALPLDVAR